MSKYMDTKTGSLEESILGVWTEAAKKQEDLDAVDKNAVKKKFADRKDKDIDNDGDTDSSDKFLHKKRKAISKAISKDEGNAFGKALKDAKEKGEKTFVVAGKKYNVKEEVELSEKSAKYLELEFKDKQTAINAYRHINNKIAAGGSQPWKDFNQEGNSLQFDKMDDADGLMKELKKKFKFKVYEREELTKENFEVGTKSRRDHTLNTTPGQSPEEFDQQVGAMQAKNNYMREALAKMWGLPEGHNPFKDKKEEKKPKVEKTMTGKKATEVKVDPDLDENKGK